MLIMYYINIIQRREKINKPGKKGKKKRKKKHCDCVSKEVFKKKYKAKEQVIFEKLAETNQKRHFKCFCSKGCERIVRIVSNSLVKVGEFVEKTYVFTKFRKNDRFLGKRQKHCAGEYSTSNSFE